MTIDERLEKLTERHEALTQTIELMAIENRERDVRWEKQQTQNKAEWDRRQAEWDKLTRFVGESLAKLAGTSILHQHLLNSHEDRLNTLEGAS